MLINISGSSGVGKTTIATLIALILSKSDNTILHLCGDDLHKWERGDDKWNHITHLNPTANKLDLGNEHILQLLSGNDIYRDHYNHDTGKFIKNIKIQPADIIINEGLHSLYNKHICKVADLNIFVHTDTGLKKEWKLNRDTQSRGYTEQQVLDAIKIRESDEKKYIQSQRGNADVVINFSKDNTGAINLNYEVINDNNIHIIKNIKRFYKLHKSFLMTCRNLSFEYELVQGAGGNISYKFDDKIVISASGFNMSDISMLNGYSVCNLDCTPINKLQKRPSMEVKMHALLKDKIVLHTHPIYLNTIICSLNSNKIISDILDEHIWVPYTTPGDDLAKMLRDIKCSSKVIILENHGLICTGETFSDALEKSLQINKLCKKWLIRNAKTFTTYTTELKSHESDKYLYPDAVILPEQNNSINNYMMYIQKEVGLTPKYLTDDEIHCLKNMEAEKYRRSLV